MIPGFRIYNLLLLIFMLLVPFSGYSQSNFEKYFKQLNINDESAITCIEVSNNSFLIGISQLGYEQNNTTVSLLTINSLGDTLWQLHKNFPYDGNLQSISKTNDGNFLVSGISVDSNSFNCWWIWKISASGQSLWYKEICNVSPTYEYGEFITELPNHHILINSTGFKTLLFDSAANFISYKSVPFFRDFHNLNYYRNNLKVKNSSFAISGIGQVNPVLGLRQVKLNSAGDTIGNFSLYSDSISIYEFPAIASSKSTEFYVSGRNFTQNPFRFGVINFDSIGNIKWKKYYPFFDNQVEFTSIVEGLDDALIVAGNLNKFTDSSKAFLFKINSLTGDSLWFRTYGNTYRTSFRDVKVCADSGFLACGAMHPIFGSSVSGSYIVKTNAQGIITNPLSVAEKQSPESLLHVYPNPSSDFLTIHYKGNEKNTDLKIFSLDGKLMFEKRSHQPEFELKISNKELSPGFYFCAIYCENRLKAYKKIIVQP